jgi:plastocyanin
MNKYLILVGFLAITTAGFIFWRAQSPSPTTEIQTPTQQNVDSKQNTTTLEFSNPKKSAHYETNTPSHGATLAGVPINVVIDFNFDLAKPSEIKILKDGQDYGVGETIIDNNKLSMRRDMDLNSPDGKYKVVYNACWPDTSCHDGSFEFAINKELAKSFVDETGSSEIVVKLSDTKFMPQDIKIKKGTTITWVNDDNSDHYINTDSHPAHTYFLDQNSRSLKKGDTYSVTFDTAGIYPYHCSAHEATMKGSILVE